MKKAYIWLYIIPFIWAQLSYTQSYDLETGYPVKKYLSQTNIASLSVSPNGKYIAIVTSKDNFDKNITEKNLWQYELNDEGDVIEKKQIPISGNSVSQINWAPNSEFLLFKSKDSIGSCLFKCETKNPQLVVPAIANRKMIEKLSSYQVLKNNKVIFYEKETSSRKSNGQEAFIKFPANKKEMRTTFKTINLKSEQIDSLFSINAQVIRFDVSPDEKHIVYVIFDETDDYFHNEYYRDANTFIMDAKTGHSKTQLTNDYVYDVSWWYGNDQMISIFSGDPTIKSNNFAYDELCFINPQDLSIQKLDPSFNGRIRSFIVLRDKKIIINAETSTSSNFFEYDKTNFRKLSDHKGTIDNLRSHNDQNLMVFSMITKDSFEEVYIARTTEELSTPIKITSFNEELTKLDTPEIEKVSWKNSEGETIEGVLMWPPGKKGASNLPLVVDIHGGPRSSRSESVSLNGVQYYYYASLLASKGFLVLEPNYTGSTGRGEKFTNALYGKPSSKPTDDILSGVLYLIQKGWADKDRMIIKGASYGGQLTNFIIGKTDMFKVALPSCGVWNEISSFGTNDGEMGQKVKFDGAKVWENPDLFREESAINNASKIKTPTLITHGEKDVRVPTHNSYAMYYTLKELGVPTELIIYKEEGHTYRKPSNKLAKVKAELEFIEKYIAK